jgi:hypothetical protein
VQVNYVNEVLTQSRNLSHDRDGSELCVCAVRMFSLCIGNDDTFFSDFMHSLTTSDGGECEDFRDRAELEIIFTSCGDSLTSFYDQ